jgi:hypothetical protein
MRRRRRICRLARAKSSARGTPFGLLGSSGLITRHSKSVRSYRLILSLNQSSARYESHQSANAPFLPFIHKLGMPANGPWQRSATRDKPQDRSSASCLRALSWGCHGGQNDEGGASKLPCPDAASACPSCRAGRYAACWMAESSQPSTRARSSRRKVHSSVASEASMASPEINMPVARSTVASTRE